jgi:hypothetical protein
VAEVGFAGQHHEACGNGSREVDDEIGRLEADQVDAHRADRALAGPRNRCQRPFLIQKNLTEVEK